MSPQLITDFIRSLPNVQSENSQDNFFFFIGPTRKIPFTTLVTSDLYDQASNLARPGIFRLNIGIGLKNYQSLFGPPPLFPKDRAIISTGHDFTQLDQLLPHPIYAAMGWVCILNPLQTWPTAQDLLRRGHQLASPPTQPG